MMRSPAEELEALRAAALHRSLQTLRSPNGRQVVLADGRELLNFSSNDYLGLATHPALAGAAARAARDFGTGAAASRLICGGSTPHAELERRTARFLAKEAALSFANGYGASVGTLGALLRENDVAILDKRCHASLIDAARLSGATIRVFPHNGLDKLARLLRSTRPHRDAGHRVLVVTESLFSMDGDIAPLADIAQLKAEHGALEVVDEAHAFGVLGPGGRGLAHAEGVADAVDFLMATFGKAAGSAGGCVAASVDWIDLILNRARSFLYSTAPPPPQPAAAAAGLEIIASGDGDDRRRRLRANISRLCGAIGIAPPPGAIVPVVIGAEATAVEASKKLLEIGLLAPAIRYPTVARGAARLRVTLSAAHTADDVDQLANALADQRSN